MAVVKVKVGSADDAGRIRAVRAAAPNARIILDANEGWSDETLAYHLAICAEAGIDLVEQPQVYEFLTLPAYDRIIADEKAAA